VWVKVLQYDDPLSREAYHTSIQKIEEPGKQERDRCDLHGPRNRQSLKLPEKKLRDLIM